MSAHYLTQYYRWTRHFQRAKVHGKTTRNGLRCSHDDTFDNEHRALRLRICVDKYSFGETSRPPLRVVSHCNHCRVARRQRSRIISRRGASARSPRPGDDQVLVAGVDVSEDAFGRLRAFGKGAEIVLGAVYPGDFGIGMCREDADTYGTGGK